jgi:hypothetical protein
MTSRMPQEPRCFDTLANVRCDLPLGHTGHHRAGQQFWAVATPDKPRWFDRLGAKDLTSRSAL